ncbi:IS3 family transposase [Myxococcus sp. AS-1-15]|nr:IS3 family transposase [Myxococcus sp. AS-1-15]
MSVQLSPSSGKPYGLALVTATWSVSRATVYRHRARRQAQALPAAQRGPKTALTDEALLEAIRGVLARSRFLREGHRKVWARLRAQDVRTSKARCLRLMRQAGLLAPGRAGRALGPRHHDGTITTDRPDVMWGTDATCTMTTLEGQATVFIAADHGTSEFVGIHAEGGHALRGPRAQSPGHQGSLRCVRPRCGHGAFHPPRQRQSVHLRRIPERAALLGRRVQSVLRP